MKKAGATSAVLASLIIPPTVVERPPEESPKSEEAPQKVQSAPEPQPQILEPAIVSPEVKKGKGTKAASSSFYTNKKLSVSLFVPDLEASDEIAIILWENFRIRATTSDIIKIALRVTAKAGKPEQMRGLYEAVKKEDGRKKIK